MIATTAEAATGTAEATTGTGTAIVTGAPECTIPAFVAKP